MDMFSIELLVVPHIRGIPLRYAFKWCVLSPEPFLASVRLGRFQPAHLSVMVLSYNRPSSCGSSGPQTETSEIVNKDIFPLLSCLSPAFVTAMGLKGQWLGQLPAALEADHATQVREQVTNAGKLEISRETEKERCH